MPRKVRTPPPDLLDNWDGYGAVRAFRWDIDKVLAAVPGESIAEKATKIGVSRQMVYLWQARRSRPGWKHCLRLAKLTGMSAPDIAGVIVQQKEPRP